MAKKKDNETSIETLQRQLDDWKRVYDEEMEIVRTDGSVVEYNSGPAMSPHVKVANLAEQNIIRLTKLLDAVKDSKEDEDDFGGY